MKKIGSLVKVDWNDFIGEIEDLKIVRGRFKAFIIHKFPFYKKGKYKNDSRTGCLLYSEYIDKLILI